MKILISAGEASGDLYASELAEALRREHPDAEFFGCAGPRMRAAGVRPIVDAASLSVVGLVEVLRHIPGIYLEFRKLVESARRERPHLAILTDSPDFHLRLAAKLHGLGVPVVYLIAPQAWAWRQGRVKQMKRHLRRLLCIFPFEVDFYRERGVPADYIGHPLTRLVRPTLEREDFFRKHRLDISRPLVALLPGSRPGEVARHLPPLAGAVARLRRESSVQFVLAAPAGFIDRTGRQFFQERFYAAGGLDEASAPVIEGETWDAIAHSRLVLAASGTVTMEAALLGTPMITFYRVNGISWMLGKILVNVPHYSMVNLIAGRRVVPELMQTEMTAERLAGEALQWLHDDAALAKMKEELAAVRERLTTTEDPIRRAARFVSEFVKRDLAHVS